jgi:two-component system, LytTR family, response regulator
MNMLRAVIIDDEQKGIDALKMLIEQYTEDVRVVASATMASKAFELIENYAPEILFLDIHMPEMNGFELLEKLNRRNFNLVFTTAHEEYALKALKNNAMDYLLKPIDRQELRFAISKIKAKLSEPGQDSLAYNKLTTYLGQNNKNKLLINSKTGIESIDVNDIIFFESRSNYTCIYLTHSKSILTSKTLKEFEIQLCVDDKSFVRVHHSYIINLNKVQRFIKNEELIVMQDNQKVPLAKSRKQEFFKWLNV